MVPRSRFIMYVTILGFSFAVGCLSQFFWDLNYGVVAPSGPPSDGCVTFAGPEVTQHVIVGLGTLFASLLSLTILISKGTFMGRD